MNETITKEQFVSNIGHYFKIIKDNLNGDVCLYAAVNRIKMTKIMNKLNNQEEILEIVSVAHRQNCDLFEYNLYDLVEDWKAEELNIPFSMYFPLKIEDYKNF